MLREQPFVADAGELEQLGCVDRAAAEDDLPGADAAGAAGLHAGSRLRPRALPVSASKRTPVAIARVSTVRFLRCRTGCRYARAADSRRPRCRLRSNLREALLAVAVDVVGARVAGLDGRVEERREQRVVRGSALEHQRSVAAAPVVLAREAGLHLLEVGQAVEVVPLLHPRLGCPALVVERVAALEDHPVDRAGAAEHLAAGVEDPAVVEVRLRVGLVLPVVEPVADREGQRRRHVDEGVDPEVRAAGLEHQDRRSRVGGEPVGERAARPSRRRR